MMFHVKLTSGRRAESAGSYQKMSCRALGTLALVAALAACQSAPAPAPAAGAAAAAPAARASIDWAALQRAVGSYEAQSHFLQAPGLNARLRALLGPRYHTVMHNLQVSGPLLVEDGTYYVSGNRAHMGGIESAAIALQPASDAVRVWLVHEGREQVIEEGRNAFAWPQPVQTMIRNQAQLR